MNGHLRSALLAIGLVTLAGCATTAPKPTADPARELREEIAPALGLEFEGDLTQGQERNFIGVRSDEILFSRRSDSRTFFVQDERWGVIREHGVFDGSDEELLDHCRKVAGQLGVPEDEIQAATVLQVMHNAAGQDPVTGELIVEEPQKGERYGVLRRSVRGVPVFSSRVVMALDRDARIGFLELHWPVLSELVIAEAQELQRKVRSGWRPPEREGGTVEAMEAGVLHSPAVGFVMDVQPAIRVIYQSSSPEAGKKPVVYLNGDGRPVPTPRQFEKLGVPTEKARERDYEGNS